MENNSDGIQTRVVSFRKRMTVVGIELQMENNSSGLHNSGGLQTKDTSVLQTKNDIDGHEMENDTVGFRWRTTVVDLTTVVNITQLVVRQQQ